MAQLEELSRRLNTARQLQSVVETMQTLASVNIRHYERSVEALSEFNRTIELGLQIALRNRPEEFTLPEQDPPGPRGMIVIGSDQGMCGSFNDRVVSRAIQLIRDRWLSPGRRRIMAVGERAASRLDMAGESVDDFMAVPGSVEAITASVRELLIALDRWQKQEQIESISLVYNRHESRWTYEPHTLDVLPLDRSWLRSLEHRSWPTRVRPTFHADWRTLFESLTRQHLFVSVYRCFAESGASENASRLQAMNAAEENVNRRISELTQQYHRERQRGITEELLDLTAGFEALSGAGSPPGGGGSNPGGL